MPRFPQPRSEDRVELRVVDESLANAIFRGIPAARLLARVRLGMDRSGRAPSTIDSLLVRGSRDYEQVTRAVARHSRVAEDEGPLWADDLTVALLAWAVACDTVQPSRDSSLAEIAPRNAGVSTCQAETLRTCVLRDGRLGHAAVDKGLLAFEACVRLSTRASLDAVGWDRLQAVAVQLERAGLGRDFFAHSESSIFAGCVDDDTAPEVCCRLVAIHRGPLDALVAADPRRFGPALWRTEDTTGSTAADLATFLVELTRLLAHDGTLVAALFPGKRPGPGEPLANAHADQPARGTVKPASSWGPLEWNACTAHALTDDLERGATTPSRAHAAVARGGETALDAIGAEMLNVAAHPFASAVCAEILARSARPRDVVRLVSYFAIAPDLEPAARALGRCAAIELPRMLGAWIQTLLPASGAAPGSSTARASACIASLRPYPRLYQTVRGLLPRSAPAW